MVNACVGQQPAALHDVAGHSHYCVLTNFYMLHHGWVVSWDNVVIMPGG